MNNTPDNLEEILSHQIFGFHQYVLTPTAHLSYVGGNLCDLLGVEPAELIHETEDRYADMVHPADRERYRAFVAALTAEAPSLTAEYRLVKKSGAVLYVRDTVSLNRREDGTLTACSVLTDLSDRKREGLHLLSGAVPCGFLRYTCEKQPKILDINDTMLEILRIPRERDGEPEETELYKSNIFLMIPMEERRRFSKYLNRVFSADAPVAGELTLLRCDGTRAHLFGWVTKCVSEGGEPEFQSICMDITEGYQARKQEERRRYLHALAEVYDRIFELNLNVGTVKCLHCEEESYFKRFENIALRIEDLPEGWLEATAIREHRDRLRRGFEDFCKNRLRKAEGRPPRITYQALDADGTLRTCTGLFIKLDDAVSLYCCRRAREASDSAALRVENDQLKESMRNLVMQFSDGIAAFELSPEGMAKPLYATENVWEFFGCTREEWLSLTKRFTPFRRFTARCEAGYEEFEVLLNTGEAEFTYFDYQSERERRIRAVCSDRQPAAGVSRYVMLYAVEEEPSEGGNTRRSARPVFIRTFGYFDVFVGDSPIAFRSKKSKELLALLVDRRGGYVTSEEAIGFLWENEPVNSLTLSRYRKVALRLKSTLEEYGISEVVEAVDGKRRIVPDRVECDLYRYRSGAAEYGALFKGSYLTNYSWGETTLGELLGHRT